LGREPRKCISYPGARPGRGVIHPASLSEAGRNDPFLSMSKPLPPRSSSGLDRFRNTPNFDNARIGPFSQIRRARRMLNILHHIRMECVCRANESLAEPVPFRVRNPASGSCKPNFNLSVPRPTSRISARRRFPRPLRIANVTRICRVLSPYHGHKFFVMNALRNVVIEPRYAANHP
jgi:hypothetical protein